MTNLIPHQQAMGEALAVIREFIQKNELDPYTKKKLDMGIVWLKFAKTYLKNIDLFIKEEYTEEDFLNELLRDMIALHQETNEEL